MTLSDYWAPGPPSPGFDLTYVFFFIACLVRVHVSLEMGSLQPLGIWVPVIVSFIFCHARKFCLLFDSYAAVFRLAPMLLSHLLLIS
jgi:hypothetical protein